LLVLTLEFILRVVENVIPVSIANYVVALTFTASASFIAVAQFGSRGAGPNELDFTPVNQVLTLDHLTDKNQQLQNKNQEPLDEVAAVRNKLVGASEAHTKVKTEKPTAKIAAWLFSRVRKRSR
jgi:hypothetical protein